MGVFDIGSASSKGTCWPLASRSAASCSPLRASASIIRYSSYMTEAKKNNKTTGQFEVKGKGWDEFYGAVRMWSCSLLICAGLLQAAKRSTAAS